MPKLSVAITINVTVDVTITVDVPVINPVVESNVNPAGKLPVTMLYVTEIAGCMGLAINNIDTAVPATKEPKSDNVVQIGCAMLMCAQML